MDSGFLRREFLKLSGYLVVGFSLLGGQAYAQRNDSERLPGSLGDAPEINSWLKIGEDGSVKVFTGKLELGQGIRIAIAQMAAEELNLDIERVSVVLADTGQTPNEGYTAGSRSIRNSATAVRYAAASARERLLVLGAEELGVPVDQVKTTEGVVSTKDGKSSVSFGTLLKGRKLEGPVKLPVALKPKEHYRYVGQPVKRRDIAKMVQGQPVYVQDLRFEGMLHARVVRPRGYGSTLLKLSEEAVRELPGVVEIVRDGSFLAVVAEDEWGSMKAAQHLTESARWSEPLSIPQKPLTELLDEIEIMGQEEVKNRGSVEPFEPTLESTYYKPYIMHASVGPSCAVAHYDGELMKVWTHTQGVFPLRSSLTGMLGLPEEKIRVIGVPGSGCYGHNGADDVAADACLIALRVPNRHLRLQWSREEEHGWEPYGSAMKVKIAARLNKDGLIDRWRHQVWTDTHSTRPGGDPGKLLAARHLAEPFPLEGRGFRGGGYRNAVPYYNFPNFAVQAYFFDGPLRVSALRSLGAYGNIFAVESMMGELADSLGTHPLDFRERHLDDPRAVDVIRRLKAMVPDRNDLGFAFSRYKNEDSYFAAAAAVSVPDGRVRVDKLWGVAEAGEIINPDGMANQIEGGMIQSASWTLKEQVGWSGDTISTLDWDDYPILRMPDVPEIQVELIDRPDQPSLGAGETAQSPTAAAIANAVRRVTGRAVRVLPINRKPTRPG